jgi:SM-20-related protein
MPPSECARLARRGFALARRGALRPAAIGRGAERALAPAVRGDLVRWIDPSAPTRGEARVLGRVERLRCGLNERLQLGAFDLELHWALYPPGAAYARHVDQARSSDARVVSLVLYLNPDWRVEDGGALRLHLAPEPIDVLPEAGTLVAFRSEGLAHEVLAARRDRLALTGWLRRRARGPAAACVG